MIKLLHTADWHIGQTFFDYNRKAEHLQFLEWLRGQLREQCVDVLLIAGDVFDTPNPSAESQKMFYKFLREITSDNVALQVVVIAGNHDSAARLEAPNPLLEEYEYHNQRNSKAYG
jgi:Exodeoxyribonuclease I subunit D (EC 3.1.11.1)